MTHVLVVDDNSQNSYLLRVLLQGSGCTVVEARHGAEALTKARQAPPDLVISDLLMPVMDGYTLLRHWKSDEHLRLIPFVVYTATYTEAEDERLALDLGADAFILKPAEPEPFMARVQAVLEQKQRGALPASQVPRADKTHLLKEYSEVLIHKLEEKALQLEQANRALQEDIIRREQADAAIKRLLDESELSRVALASSEERLRLAVDGAALGVWHWNIDSSELIWSDRCYALFGIPVDNPMSFEKFSAALHPDERARVNAAVRYSLQERTDYEIEFRTLWPDGSVHWLAGKARGFYDGAGRPERMLGIMFDITERKRAEGEKRQLELQLQQAQKMEAIGQLTAGVAHDFNNILASVLGYAALALEQHMQDKHSNLADYLLEVQTAGLRARDLIANMLSFSRSGESNRQVVMLGPLAIEVTKTLAPMLPSSIAFTARVETDGLSVLADPVRLHQVIMNLVINARDAIGEHGNIELAVREALGLRATCGGCHSSFIGDFVELAISDSGAGLPPDVLPRMFDPFFTTKGIGKGTGLGLSVVHRVVHDCGGHVLVESTPGTGTVIRVLLPLVSSIAALVSGLPEIAERAQGSGHILVVDDEDVLAQLFGEVLKAQGYQVTVCSDSRQALDIFRATPAVFDAVISDQTMPGLTGVELTHALRALRPELPIILCTGFSATLDDIVAAQLKVALLSKPVSFNALLQTLAKVLAD